MVGNLQVALSHFQHALLDEHVNVFRVVQHWYRKLVFFLEGGVADRAGGDQHLCPGVDDEIGVLAAQLGSLVVETLLQQRSPATDTLVFIHKPVFLSNSLENGLHGFSDAGCKM